MKYFDWNPDKNSLLQVERDISFEDVLVAINEDRLLDIIHHPNSKKYQDQKIFVIDINHYAYLVPFIETETIIFLKTITPSRKATKEYLIN